jgi:hypothetical protein
MGAPRDRVMLDLRGIGDSVRAEAGRRGMTVSQLARQALVATIDPLAAPPSAQESNRPTPWRSAAKLMLRMPQRQAEALILNATSLGLSYGEYVARLVEGSEMPRPTAERTADRAALLASNDKLAVLSTDLNALVRLLKAAQVEQARVYRQRLEDADAEVRRHLERASAFIGDTDRRTS